MYPRCVGSQEANPSSFPGARATKSAMKSSGTQNPDRRAFIPKTTTFSNGALFSRNGSILTVRSSGNPRAISASRTVSAPR
ncbi:hypothetical protein D3C83_101630 [compost metagenome]